MTRLPDLTSPIVMSSYHIVQSVAVNSQNFHVVVYVLSMLKRRKQFFYSNTATKNANIGEAESSFGVAFEGSEVSR